MHFQRIEKVYYQFQELKDDYTRISENERLNKNNEKNNESEKIIAQKNGSKSNKMPVEQVTGGSLNTGDKQKTEKKIQSKSREITIEERVVDGNVSDRIAIFKRSIKYWKAHPVLGIGLGSHLWNSENEGIKSGNETIHNSANWLLVELGLIGISLFSIFVILCIKALYINRNNSEFTLTTNVMITVIFLMFGASIGTEVLYQRYFWLLLGLFLAKPDQYKSKMVMV